MADPRKDALERAQLAKYRQKTNESALWGLGAGGAVIGGLSFATDGENYQADVQDRLGALKAAGGAELDRQLKESYLRDGPYGLITSRAAERLNEIIPPGVSQFEPSDLSRSGQVDAALRDGGGSATLQRQITVSPSPQPRRLSYEGLNADDVVPGQGQKGYIWANPSEPQYGYAHGNLSRSRVEGKNPAINFLAVEMDPAQRARFMTTGEITDDPTFETDRRWGQRDYGRAAGDVMFPKESIKARAEVTAADLYTHLKEQGGLPEGFEQRNLSGRNFDAAKALKELSETYAERAGKPPAEALLDLATPVKPLGITDRKTGSLPVYQQYAVDQATPEAKAKAGIDAVYQTSWDAGRSAPGEKDVLLSSYDPQRTLDEEVHFRVNPELVEPLRSRAGNFLRRPTGAGMAIAGAIASPDVVEAFEQGRPAEAAARAGVALTAGAASEAAAKQALAVLARRGVSAPLEVAARVASPLAAVQIATAAQRSTRETAREKAAAFKANPAASGGMGPSADPQLLRAEAARRRGGKWGINTPFGRFTLPELGWTEAGGLHFR